MERTYSIFLALLMAVLFAMPALAVPTNIALKTLPSTKGSLAANSVDVGPGTSVDVANGNSTMHPGGRGVYFIVQNTHASSAYTFTVTSTPDSRTGRSGDHSAYSLAAGEIGMFGPYPADGWVQTDGTIRFTGENAAIKVTPVNAN